MPAPLWILNCCIQNFHNTDWKIMRLIHGDGNCDRLLFRKATWLPQSLKLLVPKFTNHDFEDTYTSQISLEINLFKTATSKSSRKLEKVHAQKWAIRVAAEKLVQGKSGHVKWGLTSWKRPIPPPPPLLWVDVMERCTLSSPVGWHSGMGHPIPPLSDEDMERWDASLGWENKKIIWG